MLFLLCIFFPPAIPFVIVYYLMRGNSRRRQQLAAARKQTEVTEDLVAITAAPVEQRPEILRQRIESRQRATAIRGAIAVVVVVAVIGFLFGKHDTGGEVHSSSSPQSPVSAITPIQTLSAPTALPPSPAAQPADNPSATAASTGESAAFQQGLADRRTWEVWFAPTASEYRRGALYWSGQRSLPHPGTCGGVGGVIARQGCLDAKAILDPSDIRRKSEPDYRAGWNSFVDTSPVAAVPPSMAPVSSGGPSRLLAPPQTTAAAAPTAARSTAFNVAPPGSSSHTGWDRLVIPGFDQYVSLENESPLIVGTAAVCPDRYMLANWVWTFVNGQNPGPSACFFLGSTSGTRLLGHTGPFFEIVLQGRDLWAWPVRDQQIPRAIALLQ